MSTAVRMPPCAIAHCTLSGWPASPCACPSCTCGTWLPRGAREAVSALSVILVVQRQQGRRPRAPFRSICSCSIPVLKRLSCPTSRSNIVPHGVQDTELQSAGVILSRQCRAHCTRPQYPAIAHTRTAIAHVFPAGAHGEPRAWSAGDVPGDAAPLALEATLRHAGLQRARGLAQHAHRRAQRPLLAPARLRVTARHAELPPVLLVSVLPPAGAPARPPRVCAPRPSPSTRRGTLSTRLRVSAAPSYVLRWFYTSIQSF